jgi:UrcA family protein
MEITMKDQTTSKLITRLFGTALIAAVVLIGKTFAASPLDDTRSAVVNFADLNLDTAQGVSALYRRIHNAAEQVCGVAPEDRVFIEAAIETFPVAPAHPCPCGKILRTRFTVSTAHQGVPHGDIAPLIDEQKLLHIERCFIVQGETGKRRRHTPLAPDETHSSPSSVPTIPSAQSGTSWPAPITCRTSAPSMARSWPQPF